MTPRRLPFSFAAFLVLAAPGLAQEDRAGGDELRSGKSYIPTPTYSAEEDAQVLALFDGLRVADVSDGMDRAGLADVGLVHPEVHALWRDTETYKHRFIGIAVTARYVPAQDGPLGPGESDEAFDRAVGEWYSKKSPEPFVPLIRKGTALVIEDAPHTDVGSIGSNNILAWVERGCVGVVTGGTARDTDEIIAQKVPLYLKEIGRGIRPGRNVIESVNRPVVVGGVTVVPGDVVVADGDGVIVVPRKHAETVARYARATLETDKAGRRRLYEKLGLPEDPSVK
ncbi:MAG TPA: hypothetical protein VF170_00925 [Planctomycetaceae bacterium]